MCNCATLFFMGQDVGSIKYLNTLNTYDFFQMRKKNEQDNLSVHKS